MLVPALRLAAVSLTLLLTCACVSDMAPSGQTYTELRALERPWGVPGTQYGIFAPGDWQSEPSLTELLIRDADSGVQIQVTPTAVTDDLDILEVFRSVALDVHADQTTHPIELRVTAIDGQPALQTTVRFVDQGTPVSGLLTGILMDEHLVLMLVSGHLTNLGTDLSDAHAYTRSLYDRSKVGESSTRGPTINGMPATTRPIGDSGLVSYLPTRLVPVDQPGTNELFYVDALTGMMVMYVFAPDVTGADTATREFAGAERWTLTGERSPVTIADVPGHSVTVQRTQSGESLVGELAHVQLPKGFLHIAVFVQDAFGEQTAELVHNQLVAVRKAVAPSPSSADAPSPPDEAP